MSAIACTLTVMTLLAASNVPVSDVPVRRAAESKQALALHELNMGWGMHGMGTAAVVGTLAAGLVSKNHLATTQCRFCDARPDGGDALNGMDRWGRSLLNEENAAERNRASTYSDVLANVLLPVGTLGAEASLVAANNAPLRWLVEDGFILTESMALSTLLNEVAKFTAGRLRPYTRENIVTGLPLASRSVNDTSSFYSGHTSIAFNLVTTLGTLAELRGYQGRWLVWAVGLPLAAAVPPLRMAADKHYLTDVLVGAAVGSAVGVAVPLLLHGRKQARSGVSMRLAVSPGGGSLVGSF